MLGDFMIACQIKVDGEWLTGRYVDRGVERLKESWRERLGITEFRTCEAHTTCPRWIVERRVEGVWGQHGFLLIQGDLRALLVLWGRWFEETGIDHADWRIRPYAKAE